MLCEATAALARGSEAGYPCHQGPCGAHLPIVAGRALKGRRDKAQGKRSAALGNTNPNCMP
jgi:hypothetical protein